MSILALKGLSIFYCQRHLKWIWHVSAQPCCSAHTFNKHPSGRQISSDVSRFPIKTGVHGAAPIAASTLGRLRGTARAARMWGADWVQPWADWHSWAACMHRHTLALCTTCHALLVHDGLLWPNQCSALSPTTHSRYWNSSQAN